MIDEQQANRALFSLNQRAPWLTKTQVEHGSDIWFVQAFDPYQQRTVQFLRESDVNDYVVAFKRYFGEVKQ